WCTSCTTAHNLHHPKTQRVAKLPASLARADEEAIERIAHYFLTAACAFLRHIFSRSASTGRYSVLPLIWLPGLRYTSICSRFSSMNFCHPAERQGSSLVQKKVILPGY